VDRSGQARLRGPVCDATGTRRTPICANVALVRRSHYTHGLSTACSIVNLRRSNLHKTRSTSPTCKGGHDPAKIHTSRLRQCVIYNEVLCWHAATGPDRGPCALLTVTFDNAVAATALFGTQQHMTATANRSCGCTLLFYRGFILNAHSGANVHTCYIRR
jgi:hypothetical protein